MQENDLPISNIIPNLYELVINFFSFQLPNDLVLRTVYSTRVFAIYEAI